ncbi:MAG: KH domain-containing protein [Clostridia bacterium]|nr:KH domain-containing protein [Clostridia bacterium]
MPDLRQLLLDLSRAIVDNPDEVTVEQSGENDEVIFTVRVAGDDMGKIIGRHGKNARCIRTIMKAAGTNCGLRVVVDIAE